MTTIVFIPGNNTSKSLHSIQKSNWDTLLRKEFPNMQIITPFSPYDMWDKDKVNKTVSDIVEIIHTTPGDIVLLGYSFGGLITRLVYQNLSQIDAKKVKAIVTMGTPHQIPNKKQKKFVENILGLSRIISVPMIVLTGYLDLYALPVYAKLPNSNMETRSFWCFHSSFFYSKNIQIKVVKEIKSFLRKHSIS
jgi:predicted alpha/beta hydrolase family esterase